MKRLGVTEEHIVVNQITGGMKASKAQRYDLIPPRALGYVTEIYEYGTHKYSPWNWRKGYDWGLSYSALHRHLALFWDGEDLDEESGLRHMAHAGWHCLTLLTFMDEFPQLDDRYSTVLRNASQ